MSSTRVCMEFDFLNVQVIKSQQHLWNCKIFFSNLSKILQKYLKKSSFKVQLRWFFKILKNIKILYSIDSRALRTKNYVVYAEFPMGLKFNFSEWKTYFSYFIFIDKYLKFKEIECLVHYVMCEMWPTSFYVNFFIFNIETQNCDIVFINSSLDSKLKILNVVLKLYFKPSLNSQKH